MSRVVRTGVLWMKRGGKVSLNLVHRDRVRRVHAICLAAVRPSLCRVMDLYLFIGHANLLGGTVVLKISMKRHGIKADVHNTELFGGRKASHFRTCTVKNVYRFNDVWKIHSSSNRVLYRVYFQMCNRAVRWGAREQNIQYKLGENETIRNFAAIRWVY